MTTTSNWKSIPIVDSGDSLDSGERIPDFKVMESGFRSLKFRGFRSFFYRFYMNLSIKDIKQVECNCQLLTDSNRVPKHIEDFGTLIIHDLLYLGRYFPLPITLNCIITTYCTKYT